MPGVTVKRMPSVTVLLRYKPILGVSLYLETTTEEDNTFSELPFYLSLSRQTYL